VPFLRLELVKRREDVRSFVVLARRWVVERTFPGSDETGVSPKTSRTLAKPWLRVPVERDHGFRWKLITQSGAT
jgi:transposase